MIIYVCSAYSGIPGLNDNREENIKAAEDICRFIMKKGYTPFAPHLLYTRFTDDDRPDQRKAGIRCGLEMLSRCDEMWVCGKKFSEGMIMEINAARRFGINIRYFMNRLPEVLEECLEL